MTRPAPLPRELPPDFTVAHALALGATRTRLRSLDLSRPHHGVRTRSDVACITDAARHLDLLLQDRESAFSHLSAAHLLGMPTATPWLPSDPLDVMTPNGRGHVRRPGVTGRRGLELRTTTEVNGLRVTDGIDTWCDLASMLQTDDLVRAGDWLLRPSSPLTVADLQQRMRPLIAGRGRLREALRWIRPGSASPRETTTRLLIVRDGLPEPRLNVELNGPTGWVATVDLWWDEWRLAMDYDGRYHRDRAEQMDYDLDRAREIRAIGYRFEQVTSKHLGGRHPQVLSIVREALLQAGWRPEVA